MLTVLYSWPSPSARWGSMPPSLAPSPPRVAAVPPPLQVNRHRRRRRAQSRRPRGARPLRRRLGHAHRGRGEPGQRGLAAGADGRRWGGAGGRSKRSGVQVQSSCGGTVVQRSCRGRARSCQQTVQHMSRSGLPPPHPQAGSRTPSTRPGTAAGRPPRPAAPPRAAATLFRARAPPAPRARPPAQPGRPRCAPGPRPQSRWSCRPGSRRWNPAPRRARPRPAARLRRGPRRPGPAPLPERSPEGWRMLALVGLHPAPLPPGVPRSCPSCSRCLGRGRAGGRGRDVRRVCTPAPAQGLPRGCPCYTRCTAPRRSVLRVLGACVQVHIRRPCPGTALLDA